MSFKLKGVRSHCGILKLLKMLFFTTNKRKNTKTNTSIHIKNKIKNKILTIQTGTLGKLNLMGEEGADKTQFVQKKPKQLRLIQWRALSLIHPPKSAVFKSTFLLF